MAFCATSLQVPDATTRGFGAEQFIQVAETIDHVLQDPEDEDVQQAVKTEVEDLCERFSLYDFGYLVDIK